MQDKHPHLVHVSKDSSPARPIVRQSIWLQRLIWIVPICAAIAAGFYFKEYLAGRGHQITLKFANADGIKVGDTPVMHRGVLIGKVISVGLSERHNEAEIGVRLWKNEDDFARRGAQYWVVRPEISASQLTGLNTVFSGPYIDSNPGPHEAPVEKEFAGLSREPRAMVEGVEIVLHAKHVGHLQTDSPIFYRGIQVGVVRDVRLDRESDHIDVYSIIWPHYSPLVRVNSKFWNVGGFDVKGGIFSGLEMKFDSLQTLVSGGIEFATPDKDMGNQAREKTEFMLEESAKKDWLEWAPKIQLR